MGWRDMPDGTYNICVYTYCGVIMPSNCGRCAAPATYAGLCKSQQMFALASGMLATVTYIKSIRIIWWFGVAVVEKEEIEVVCKVCWPCECERDWEQPCPSGRSSYSCVRRSGIWRARLARRQGIPYSVRMGAMYNAWQTFYTVAKYVPH